MRLFKCLVPVLVLLFVEGSSARPGPTTMRDIAIVRDTIQIGEDNKMNVGNHNERYANTATNAGSRGKVNQFPMTYRNQEIAAGQYAGWLFDTLPGWLLGAQGSSRPGHAFIFGNNSTVTGGSTGIKIEVPLASKADPKAGSSEVGGFVENAGKTEFTSDGSASPGSSPGGQDGLNGDSIGVKATAGAAAIAVAPSGNRTDGSTISGPTTMRDIATARGTLQIGKDNTMNVGNHEGSSGWVQRANSSSKADAYAGSSGVGGFGGNAGNTGFTSVGSASSESSLGGSNGGSFGVKATAGAAATAVAPSGNTGFISDGSASSESSLGGSNGGSFGVKATAGAAATAVAPSGNRTDGSTVSDTIQSGTDNTMNVGNHEGSSGWVQRANSSSKADAYAGSNGVGGFGGNAGKTEFTSDGSASSGSSLGGDGGSNGGFFGVNAKADAVATAGASSGNRTDASTVYGANQQGSSGGLHSAISNAHSNANGGSTSSSSKSTANGWGNAMAQLFSSAISTDGGKSSASSYASASANTNV